VGLWKLRVFGSKENGNPLETKFVWEKLRVQLLGEINRIGIICNEGCEVGYIKEHKVLDVQGEVVDV